ncbi:GspH/FimT family pseudopilin [Shewanella sp. SR44-3]|uniref:GspH/FimT family pseudopilin n=1 Tax=unclassified Shewanella TaxID=196818 RepID=UPI0015F9D257|nr:GspH/FimT family pseudopilin [Shewanella sp. SR44-3]MBB1269247.1 GspH/FimT family pseudopilin [Shewanella sp. SR44-3]
MKPRCLVGFSLVELIVTLVVAMLLITVGVPSMKSLYEGIRVQNIIDTIESSFVLARNQAVNYGSRVSICPLKGNNCSGNWIDGFSVFIDNGVAGTIDTTSGITDTVITVVSGFNDDDFIKSDLNIFSFNADGLVAASGLIRYCPGSKTNPDSKAAEIGSAGKVKLIETGINCN